MSRFYIPILISGGLALGGAIGLRPLIRASMRPEGAFSDAATPPAPDYDQPGAWSALPDQEDLADIAPDGVTSVDQRVAPVDVFYVHPTSYIGSQWNGAFDDRAVVEATDRGATLIQATAFNGCCAIYAPRYRQTNGTQFLEPSDDGSRAFQISYGDVLRAFEAFQQIRGAERPFILAGHSQGSVLLERLLFEHISGTPLRDQLVAAWIPGGSVTVDGLRERAPDLPPCAQPTDLRCVAAWEARAPGYQPKGFDLVREDARERLCVNPLSWRQDEERAPAETNLGAVFLESADRAPRPGFADARCADGVLETTLYGRPPRDGMSRILDWTMGSGNLHPIEYQLYFMNLRENANLRVQLALAEREVR